jgi:glycosyltransferase involved in cell wall biosynthesis
MSEPLPITAVILTFNEERHIARALKSIAFCKRVVVIDSGSTDRTVELAKAGGAEVLHHQFVNYSEQFGWGLENARIDTAWTLRLDADEIIEPDLADRLKALMPTLPDDVTGVNFKRKHVFMGRFVRHGGRWPLVLLRLWRTGKGRIEIRWMDEHIVVKEGRTITIDGGFADVNLNDSRFFTDKHNGYATREAIDALTLKYGLLLQDNALDRISGSWQVSFKRKLKEKFYNRLPFGVGPLGYFLWRFIFQLGFLDGTEGRIYHVLQGFWYRFLVDVRRLEFERAMSGAASDAERLSRLSEASGYDLILIAAAGESSDRNSGKARGTVGLPLGSGN